MDFGNGSVKTKNIYKQYVQIFLQHIQGNQAYERKAGLAKETVMA